MQAFRYHRHKQCSQWAFTSWLGMPRNRMGFACARIYYEPQRTDVTLSYLSLMSLQPHLRCRFMFNTLTIVPTSPTSLSHNILAQIYSNSCLLLFCIVFPPYSDFHRPIRETSFCKLVNRHRWCRPLNLIFSDLSQSQPHITDSDNDRRLHEASRGTNTFSQV